MTDQMLSFSNRYFSEPDGSGQTLGDRWIRALFDLSKEEAERVTRELADELGIKAGILINGTRTVVTGQAAGAGLFDVLMAIGGERVIARLKKFSQEGLN